MRRKALKMENKYYDPLEMMHASAFLRAAGIDIPKETCHLVCIEQNAFRTLLQCDNCFHEIIEKSSNANTNYDRCPSCGARVVWQI